MKRLLKYTTLIMMALMVSGSVWANSYTDHITAAPNNKGDVLIFPWFLAQDGGWQTKLTVINTDETNSVVAKLIIRSFKNSQELLDFFLYLSPADVWTGVIRYDSIKKAVVIFSDDDSALSEIVPSLVWANVAPIDQKMFPIKCTGDLDSIGYVEVLTSAVGPVAPASPGVAKQDIYDDYAALLVGNADSLVFAGDLPQAARVNVLAGYMQFMNLVGGLDASLRATTLKDYANLEAMSTGSETRLGALAMNSLAEVEASLTKDDIAMPYVNADDVAVHLFTYPTKLTDIASCGDDPPDSPYFANNFAASDYCVPYTVITYDLTEKFPESGSPFSGGGTDTREFCDEVNWIVASDFQFPEGWAHYYFGDSTTSTTHNASTFIYKGTPVIPTYFYIGAAGLSANYGAWTDGLVFCADGVNTLVDYQYTDSFTPLCTTPVA
jgi:hypothetical protein